MSKTNKKQLNKKQFSIVPSVLFILSVVVYIIGTFLPWFPGNLYDLSKLSGGAVEQIRLLLSK